MTRRENHSMPEFLGGTYCPICIDSVSNGIFNCSISIPVAAIKKASEDQPNTKALR